MSSQLTNDQLYQVLLAPVVTEKSTRAAEQDGQAGSTQGFMSNAESHECRI